MAVIRRLIGVYDAKGSFGGEVAYSVGKILGRRHCALCEITHGWSPVEKRASRACRAGLPVPFELVHLDGRTPAITEASEGRTPTVLAETDEGLVELVDSDALNLLGRDPQRLVSAIEDAVESRDLDWVDST
jgi:hypothetical protein